MENNSIHTMLLYTSYTIKFRMGKAQERAAAIYAAQKAYTASRLSTSSTTTTKKVSSSGGSSSSPYSGNRYVYKYTTAAGTPVYEDVATGKLTATSYQNIIKGGGEVQGKAGTVSSGVYTPSTAAEKGLVESRQISPTKPTTLAPNLNKPIEKKGIQVGQYQKTTVSYSGLNYGPSMIPYERVRTPDKTSTFTRDGMITAASPQLARASRIAAVKEKVSLFGQSFIQGVKLEQPEFGSKYSETGLGLGRYFAVASLAYGASSTPQVISGVKAAKTTLQATKIGQGVSTLSKTKVGVAVLDFAKALSVGEATKTIGTTIGKVGLTKEQKKYYNDKDVFYRATQASFNVTGVEGKVRNVGGALTVGAGKKELFVSEIKNIAQEKGLTPSQTQSFISAQTRRRTTVGITEPAALVAASGAIEFTGTKQFATILPKIGEQGTKYSAFKASMKAATAVTPTLAKLGAIEGAVQTKISQDIRGEPRSYKEIGKGALFGAISAPVIGGGIVAASVGGKAKLANVLEKGVYITDPTEFGGDVLARQYEKVSSAITGKEIISPKVFTVSTKVGTKTSTTVSFTKPSVSTNIFGGVSTSVNIPVTSTTPIATKSMFGTPIPVSPSLPVQPSVPINIIKPGIPIPPTKPNIVPSNFDIGIGIPVSPPTETETETETPVEVNTEVSLPIFTDVTIPVTTPNKFTFGIPPFWGGLGKGGGSNIVGRSGGRKYQRIASLEATQFNIKAKRSQINPILEGSGLGIRPIIK